MARLTAKDTNEKSKTEPRAERARRGSNYAPAPSEYHSLSDQASITQYKDFGDQPDENLHRTIAQRAFLLYEESGFQHGNDVEHWLEAERQVKTLRI